MAKYYYFRPEGKWKHEGTGKDIPRELWSTKLTHDMIVKLNDSMPGIAGDGKDFIVVIINNSGFPRMIPAVLSSVKPTIVKETL